MDCLVYKGIVLTSNTLISVAKEHGITLSKEVADKWFSEACRAAMFHICTEDSAVEHLLDKIFGGETAARVTFVRLSDSAITISPSLESIDEKVERDQST